MAALKRTSENPEVLAVVVRLGKDSGREFEIWFRELSIVFPAAANEVNKVFELLRSLRLPLGKESELGLFPKGSPACVLCSSPVVFFGVVRNEFLVKCLKCGHIMVEE